MGIAILQQIDQLETERCEECLTAKGNQTRYRCKCKASVQIQRLGKRLGKLVNERAQDRLLKTVTRNNLNAELYQELRDYGVRDYEIAERLKLTKVGFYELKVEKNLPMKWRVREEQNA